MNFYRLSIIFLIILSSLVFTACVDDDGIYYIKKSNTTTTINITNNITMNGSDTYVTNLTIQNSTNFIKTILLTQNNNGSNFSATFTGGNVSKGTTYNTNYYLVAETIGNNTVPFKIFNNVYMWDYRSAYQSGIGNSIVVYHDADASVYSSQTGDLTNQDMCNIERDGTIYLTNDATTWNIVQEPFDNWAGTAPSFDKDYYAYLMPITYQAYFNFVIPHDIKDGTAPYVLLHYLPPDSTCDYQFYIYTRYADACSSSWTTEEYTLFDYCEAINNYGHAIDLRLLESTFINMEGILQIRVTRIDECRDDPYVLALNIIYEQDTYGSREYMTK